MPAELRKIVEILPCGFISVSPKGEIKELNSYVLDLLEYNDKNLLIGTSFIKLLSVGSKMFFEFNINPVLHLSGILKEIKLDLKKKNGSLINVLVNLRVVHDENNQFKEIQITVFDFTQRENFEKEILQTNKRYGDLVEKLQEQNQQIREINSRIEALLMDAPIGVFVFTLNAKGKMDITYANDEFYGIFFPLLDKSKLIDVEILISHISVNDRERVLKSIYYSYEHMTLFKEEFDFCFNENEKIFLRFISHPISKVDGKVVWNGSVENITEKQALAENLHFFKQGFADKKSRFELLTSFNKIGYWELNLKTGEGIVNHVFYTLLGRKLPGNVFEKNNNFFEECVLFLHPNDLENFTTTRRDFEKNNSDYFEFEGRMLNNNGNWIWIWTKASLVKEGTHDLLIGTCIDITQQKELEDKEIKNNEILKENNNKYEEILNNSSDLIFSLDSNLKIDFVNQTWLCKTLYEETEIIGKPVLDFIENSQKDQITELFNQLSYKETVLEVELNMLNKQGKKLSCLAKLSSTFSYGQGLNIRGYLKDITDQKEVSFQLNQTLNNIKDGYAFIDSNFNILEWNKSAERILNLEKKLVYNKNIYELFPEMADSYVFNKVKELFDSKSFGDFEYFSANLNTWLHLIFTPTLSGMAILFSDITERKRQEGLLRLETNVYSNFLNSTNEDIDGLLETICKQIKEFHPLMIFSTLKVINSRIYNWISPDLPLQYLKDIEGAPIGPKAGSCGTAAFTKKNVIVEDIFNDELWEDYTPLAIKYNLGACWSFPIFSEDNEVIATFAIYHKTQKLMSSAEFNTIDKVRFLIQSLLQINSSRLKHNRVEALNISIINSSLNAIFISRNTGECVLWNAQAEKVFGWKPEEIIGQNLAEKLLPTRFLPRVKTQINYYQKTGRGAILNKEILYIGKHKNEKEISVELIITSAKIEDEDMLIFFVRDISAIKMQLNEIKQKNKKLKEISWLQSHVIRAPLAKVMGLVSLLEEEVAASLTLEQFEIFQLIQKSSNELDDVIKQITEKTADLKTELK